jgi:hypothetical protein
MSKKEKLSLTSVPMVITTTGTALITNSTFTTPQSFVNLASQARPQLQVHCMIWYVTYTKCSYVTVTAMNAYRYTEWSNTGLFNLFRSEWNFILTLCHGNSYALHLRVNNSLKIFFSESIIPRKLIFCRNIPWVVLSKICSYGSEIPIFSKQEVKNHEN